MPFLMPFLNCTLGFFGLTGVLIAQAAHDYSKCAGDALPLVKISVYQKGEAVHEHFESQALDADQTSLVCMKKPVSGEAPGAAWLLRSATSEQGEWLPAEFLSTSGYTAKRPFIGEVFNIKFDRRPVGETLGGVMRFFYQLNWLTKKYKKFALQLVKTSAADKGARWKIRLNDPRAFPTPFAFDLLTVEQGERSVERLGFYACEENAPNCALSLQGVKPGLVVDLHRLDDG